MLFVFIVLVIIAAVLVVREFIDDLAVGFGALGMAIILLLVPFIMVFRWQISDATYTGYIYSRESAFGYTTYHIRFSQHAGSDKQPSFSVQSGSDQERKLDKLVGTEKKVQVRVPANSPRFVNNPFEPNSLAEVEEML